MGNVNRTLCQFNLSDDGEVTLRMQGSSRRIKARALEIIKTDDGLVRYACLDRLIHRTGEQTFSLALGAHSQVVPGSSVTVTGCFATELHFYTHEPKEDNNGSTIK